MGCAFLYIYPLGLAFNEILWKLEMLEFIWPLMKDYHWPLVRTYLIRLAFNETNSFSWRILF